MIFFFFNHIVILSMFVPPKTTAITLQSLQFCLCRFLQIKPKTTQNTTSLAYYTYCKTKLTSLIEHFNIAFIAIQSTV